MFPWICCFNSEVIRQVFVFFQVDSLLLMLQSDDVGCRKNACFAASCLAINTVGHFRILKNKYSDRMFSSIVKMLSSADEESLWFAAM